MINNLKQKSSEFIADNPKTVFWTLALSAGSAVFFVMKHVIVKNAATKNDLVKIIQDGEVKARNKRNDTECDVLRTAAQTACKIMEQATAVAPELKNLKNEIISIKQELKAKKNAPECVCTNSTDSIAEAGVVAEPDYEGISSSELFSPLVGNDNSPWIVDGYMKEGLINFLVAGAGVGKSIMMVQIALAVAKGQRPEFLPDGCSASNKKDVVFYRLEDFPNELQGKYGDGLALKDSDIKWFLPAHLSESSLEGFITHLNGMAEKLTEDTVVFIDPATKLSGYKHKGFISGLEEAQNKAKSRGVNMSIVASVHLYEIKDWTPLVNGDVKGGDLGLQQAGSVTALRKERTSINHRFLQCLKAPKGSKNFLSGDVLVCKTVEKPLDDRNKHLYYQYEGTKPEAEALPVKPKPQPTGDGGKNEDSAKKAPNQKVTPEMVNQMIEMLEQNISHEEIAKQLDVSTKTVGRYKKQLSSTEASLT